MAETRSPQLPQVYEPKELATVSRIEAYFEDPCLVHEKVEEEDHRAPITEEVSGGI